MGRGALRQVGFLGGASGVGASCVLIHLGPCAALIDAGVRMDAGDRLPDLAMLEEVHPACVLVTHAHADHIGALPLVHESFLDIPIYASSATARLMAVMLADATRVMARRAHDELEPAPVRRGPGRAHHAAPAAGAGVRQPSACPSCRR